MRLGPLGIVWIAGTRRGVVRVDLGGTKRNFLRRLPEEIAWIEDAGSFASLASRLRRMAGGHATAFDVSLDLRCGTPFQRRVWKAIATIPRGETRSYAWLARAAGRPRAVRAAANACGANPVPLLIPCHRVIASDGTLGGFSSGVAIKKTLLALEGYP